MLTSLQFINIRCKSVLNLFQGCQQCFSIGNQCLVLPFPFQLDIFSDSPSLENGLAETALSGKAVGINGFTGCSLWIEPELGVDIVFMSNRVHPLRSNQKIRTFRPELINAVLGALSKLSF